MGARTQRLKGVMHEVLGKTRGSASHASGDTGGELKAAGQVTKGKVEKTVGKARGSARR
jgi:uncharacterized protein YjbJ (UPF0337 family)